ncbi:retention module-containing protein [Shewanella algae]|uniref:Hemolysin IA n=1 Tax=Shewanella algae TaxID=38313 RepID=A0A379ZXT8_9GAMM|nr:retention module-containing protein [Shewanella algae]MBO2609445.1 retention module-containing protein [Shewanella algae]SUI69536.1 Hemolysin IA [Shewanella algae]
MGVAISKQDAVVTNLVGQLKAKDENGNIRDLSIGDLIRNGEEIIFTANDTFTIEYADGTRLTEQNAQPSAQPQPDSAAADVAQFANSGVDAEIAALQAQILAGDDPTANLPATAAGAGTAGNQGDFGYVAVDRDGSELLASAGYDTSGFDQTAITTQEEILLEDLPLTGPTLNSGAATLSDANLPTGTTPSPTALTQTGNLSFSAAAGVASLTLDGVAIVSGGVFNGPVSINTEYGVLTINAVDLINGNISYSFTLNSAVDHSSSDDFSQAFNLILTDLEGNSVGNTLTISVLDDAPSGQDDINSVDEDSLLAISGNLLDNDVQGGDTAQVTAAGSGGNLDNAVSNQSQVSGSYGLLTLNADGSYNYQINSAAQAVQALAQGESLTEVFSYLLTDADGDTSVQTLTITITGTNDVPVISTSQPGEADGAVREAGQFDDGSIDPGTPGVSGQLSASDVDNGAVLIWSGSADSPLGSFSIDAATGAWNYQLDNAAADGLLEGEIRTETFSVTVTDEFGASAEQLVTITIIGTNDAPILSADSSGSLTEDLDVINGMLSDSGSLSFTDVDIGDSHSVSSSYNGDVSWSGGALDQATQDALAAGFSADNSGWSYDIANSLVQFLAVGETITLSFTLTVTDAFGASDSQLVTLTITGTNDGPVINPPGEGDADGTVREAGQFDDSSVDPGTPGVSGQLSASDVDNGADLTWSGSADSPLGSFSVDAATGAWNYQLDNAAVDGLLEGEIRTETFTVTVTDEYGASAEQLVTITIIGTNDAPILSADASGAVIEDIDVINGMLSDSGSLSFTDVDIGDSHVVSSSYNGDASWSGGALDQATQDALAAGFSVDNSGWSYDIANSLVQFLAVGETITLSFTLTVTDAFGASDSQPVTVTITGTNDVPVLSIDMSGAVTEDVDVINGMLSDSGDLSFTDVDINDSHSVGSSYNGDVLWSGGALDQATQDALAAGFSVDNSGWSYDIANSLVQFLAVGETITLSFDVTVDDGNGGTDTDTVTVTITGTNDAPVLSIDMSGAVTEDVDVMAGMLSDSGVLSFTDVDLNDSHSVGSSYNNNVSWSGGALDQATQDALAAGFSVDNSGWSYDIANSLVQFLAVGETITLSFDVTVDDGNGGTDTDTVTVTITGTNDAPVLSIDMSGAVTEDVDVLAGMLSDSGDLSFTDVDINDGHSVGSSYNGDVLWSGGALDQATQDALAAGFSVDNAGWSYDIANSLVEFLAVGETITLSFDVTVDDGNGGTDTDTVTVTITGTNDAPVLSIDMSGAVTEDVDVVVGMLSDSGDLSFTDVDINDSHSVGSSYNGDVLWSGGALDQATQDALAAGFSVDNAGWSYDIANSLVQFLAVGETITLSFDVTVDDGNGGTDTDTVTVTITGTNDAPVLSIDMSGAVTEDVDVLAGMLSDSGSLSFTDVDINDSHSVGSSYNGDVLWSGGALDQATQDALAAGFSVDNAGWSYDIANSLVQFLAVGETITLSFDVSVDDGNGGTDTDTVTVTITGTNDAPVLSIDMSGAVTEDVDVINGMLSDSGDLSFTDVDINDSHSVGSSYNGDVLWSGGALDQATQDALAAGFSVDNAGWSYDIANSLVQFLAVGETITLSFDVTVDDGNGGTDTDTVTVTITGTNDAPVLSIDMSGAVTEDVDVVAGMLSDSGDLSFTDVDINDSHSVGSSYNGDVLWSGGALDQATQDALAAGFSVDNAGWIYDIANSLVQFLAVGETITLSFDVTVDDGNGGTDTETVTITINGTNDPVEGEFAKEIWVPASLLQLSDPYLAGYPLNIDVPTDVDATDDISITNLSLEFIDPGETAEIGSIWYWDEDIQMLVQYDFNNPEALSATELGSLVYMPGDNGDIEEQLDISLTFTVNSGTDQVDGDFIIHAVPGNSLGGESVTIGDGSSPLTSGNDQDAVLSISGGFADAINLDPANGSLDLFTDYQKSPFAIPIPGDERDIDTTAGSKRETEVSVRLTINGITFIVLLADPVDSVEQTWFYDADSGLMKASIGYDQIVQESDNSVTLADYLTLNPAQAGDLWTITYFDNDGGSYQARYVQAVFTHELLPDDAITVTGTDDIDNLIFGSTQSDSLTGANQSDEIVGREGNDTIYGLEGDDQLLGGAGNDYIFGGTGADYLVGGPGSDRLDAGIDNDRDILIWDAGSADGSTDEVYNFDPNTDALDLSDILVNEENGVLDDYLDFSFVGGNTIISVDTTGAGGDSVTIVLNGVDLSTEYGTTDEGVIIQSLISDGALLVTQPVVQASLPEPNYTYSSEEQLIP